MMDTKWVRCDDLVIAAAFGVLGVPIKTNVQVRADSGDEYVTTFLRPESVTQPHFKTAALMKLLKSGELQKQDAEHPLLYAIEAVKSFIALKGAIKAQERVILITRKGTLRTAYVRESAAPKTLGTIDRFLNGGTP